MQTSQPTKPNFGDQKKKNGGSPLTFTTQSLVSLSLSSKTVMYWAHLMLMVAAKAVHEIEIVTNKVTTL